MNLTEIFTFDPNYVYRIVLSNGVELSGYVIEVYANGVVLSDMVHIPTASIMYFVPLIEQKNETTRDFMV